MRRRRLRWSSAEQWLGQPSLGHPESTRHPSRVPSLRRVENSLTAVSAVATPNTTAVAAALSTVGSSLMSTWHRRLAAGCAVAAAIALVAAATRARRWRSSRGQLIALREALKLRQALQHKLGLDIGGTLAKIVLAIDPAAREDQTAVREIVTWNDVTTMHDDLSFTARSGGFAFAFIETPTETLEETARAILSPRRILNPSRIRNPGPHLTLART